MLELEVGSAYEQHVPCVLCVVSWVLSVVAEFGVYVCPWCVGTLACH